MLKRLIRALPLLWGAALLGAPATAQDRTGPPASFERVDHLAWNADGSAPLFVTGALRAPSSKSPAAVAEAFLDEQAAWLGVSAASDFAVARIDEDPQLKQRHVRVMQEVGGVPIFGAESIVHLDASGAVYAFGGTVHPGVALSTQPGIGAGTALEAARSTLAPDAVLAIDAVAPDERAALAIAPSARLVIYPEDGGTYRLAYLVDLQVATPDPARWQVFVDAQTGEVFPRFNAIHTAAGHAHRAAGPTGPEVHPLEAGHPDALLSAGPTVGSGTSVFGGTKTLDTEYVSGSYRLRDLTRTNTHIRTMTANNGFSLPGVYITDSDNQFTATNQRAGVDAHWGAAQTYDYYLGTHGRNSYTGSGTAITSTVRYGSNYNNAFWNGSQMVYGDGDGTTFIPLAALDIVAHELTHAVTEYTAGLIYQNESGALNEAVSDIFGAMVDHNDWLMGEDAYTPGIAGDALRSLSNPRQFSYNLGAGPTPYPDHYADRYRGSGDYGGVHINSSIFNKAAYLMAAGGIHRGVSVASMGRAKTERVWYRALAVYFSQSTGYTGARSGVLQATADLYGSGSAEYTTVQNAFAAVGIGSPGGGSGPLVASATGPNLIYRYQSGTFQASATGGSAPYTFTWEVKPICSTPPPPPPPPPPGPDPDPWPDPNPCDPWDPNCHIPFTGGSEERTAGQEASEAGDLLRGPSCNVWSYAGSGATLTYNPGSNGVPYGTFQVRSRARDGQNATDYSNVLSVEYRNASAPGPGPDPDPWPDPNPCDPWDPNCHIPFDASLTAGAAPDVLTLESARPNPFSERAELSIGVPEAGAAHVAVYDLLGREVSVLRDGALAAGWHQATLDGRALAPGVYVVRAVVAGEAVTTRITRVE